MSKGNVKVNIKEWLGKLGSKIVQLPLKTKIMIGSAAGVSVMAIVGYCLIFSGKEEVVYVETVAEVGNLTIGITETGNVEVEEEKQTFDIDISEYSSDASVGFAWQSAGAAPGGSSGQMGGMNMMQMFGGTSTSGENRELVVEEVFVSVGQEITAGTPICSFSEDSLASIKNGLVDDEAAAGSTLQERETDLEVSELAASQELEQNVLYGELAQLEYNSTVKNLEAKVEEAQDKVTEAEETLAENTELLTAKQEELDIARQVLANADYIINGVDLHVSLESWIEAENNRRTSDEMVDSLEQEVEKLTDTVEENTKQVSNLKMELVNTQKSYDTGVIDAKAQYGTRMLKYNSAQEIYDTAIASSSLSYEIASDEYEDAKQKLDEFNAVVVGNNLVASSDGVISEVAIEAGDSVYKNSSIITYNAYEEVSITVTLEEADREKIQLGSAANVTVDALPEELFIGEVTEIGDAVYDNDSGVNTYEVTVSLSGNLEKVFDGMSAEITLITKEQQEVLYVANRSIIREGSKSYVKVRNESGRIEKIEVETGFSDGINVEIVGGISEGTVVLVESKVSGS